MIWVDAGDVFHFQYRGFALYGFAEKYIRTIPPRSRGSFMTWRRLFFRLMSAITLEISF